MSLFVIGDPHLSFSVNKPMDVFGPLWEDYENKLVQSFSELSDDDITIIPGDLSWGMSLKESLLDFKSCVFLESVEHFRWQRLAGCAGILDV